MDTGIKLKKKPTEYLRDMYLRHAGLHLGSAAAPRGRSRLEPTRDRHRPSDPVAPDNPIDHIMNAPGFSDEERIAMLGGTAAKLLKIKL